MNTDVVKEWLLKAEHDLKTTQLIIASEADLADVACYHAQQCVEKYLKAWLVYNGEEIIRTHNITILLEKCIQKDGGFEILFEHKVDKLTEYATEIRYPGSHLPLSAEDSREALF